MTGRISGPGAFLPATQVQIIHGDGKQELPGLLPAIQQPCLFWLDAHNFDLETPVREELQAVASHLVPGHVILVDDSKWFDGRNQYPTMEWVRQFVERNLPGYELIDEMHMIRIVPQ